MDNTTTILIAVLSLVFVGLATTVVYSISHPSKDVDDMDYNYGYNGSNYNTHPMDPPQISKIDRLKDVL